MSVRIQEDNELVQLYINGNEEALSTLLQRHKRRIFSSIYVIVRDRALAEDLFQDTFFKVIQTLKRNQYSEEGKFLPWVLRIARNLIIDHFRKNKKLPTVPVYVTEDGEEVDVFATIPSDDDGFKSKKEQIEFRKKVRGMIRSLPDEQKEVVIMRMYYDMSFKEIADFCNVSINTSLGRMRYALINLKKMIEESKTEVFI
jgi:RNA polymerase sigma-70 factor (ECF subfamily)